MAKYVIERQGDRFFIKKSASSREAGRDITDIVGYLYARHDKLCDGQRVSIWNTSAIVSKYPYEAIRDARDLAERMRDILEEETGVDCLGGGQGGMLPMQRAMIAYRLHLLGYSWGVASSAVDRSIPSCMKVDPRRFVSDNENSLWNKILKVR